MFPALPPPHVLTSTCLHTLDFTLAVVEFFRDEESRRRITALCTSQQIEILGCRGIVLIQMCSRTQRRSGSLSDIESTVGIVSRFSVLLCAWILLAQVRHVEF